MLKLRSCDLVISVFITPNNLVKQATSPDFKLRVNIYATQFSVDSQCSRHIQLAKWHFPT